MVPNATEPVTQTAMNQIVDSQGAADLLHTHAETVEAMARRGELPRCKPGRKWIFLLDELVEWVRTESKKNTHRESEPDGTPRKAPARGARRRDLPRI